MSLLREIQDEVAQKSDDTTTILRKCKILAARLKSGQLAQWVDCELNGYPKAQPIPGYRRLTVIYYASFANSAWQVPKTPIPSKIVPEQHRESFNSIEFREGMAKADTLARSKVNITVHQPDLVPAVDGKIYPNMSCHGVWAEIPPNEFQQLTSAVKNRILDFVLKLESENPDAGEAPPNTAPIPAEKLQPLVQNIFYGSVGAIAQNSQHFSQTVNTQVSAHDIAKLAAELGSRLDELNLPQAQKKRAEAQLEILKTEATVGPDSEIVRQAGCSLRSVVEGAVGSLIATATQPTIWHWIHQMLATLSK